jgi:hypothetical protein
VTTVFVLLLVLANHGKILLSSPMLFTTILTLTQRDPCAQSGFEYRGVRLDICWYEYSSSLGPLLLVLLLRYPSHRITSSPFLSFSSSSSRINLLSSLIRKLKPPVDLASGHTVSSRVTLKCTSELTQTLPAAATSDPISPNSDSYSHVPSFP